ncbi:MAG TPA: carboxylating nicotinate-nucleotide diphosphorylase, partial [Candidatus Eisenbacteria bacterium]|nr:carboxylating nicotinate-nucleotide diphosphorylase [Candidatus Eisenbacteria bacterium]
MVPLVQAALSEDVGPGDATTLALIAPQATSRAEIRSKATGVLAGLPVAREVFLQVDPGLIFEPDREDGDPLTPGTIVARVHGRTRGILTAERTALNFLQHLSGIATATHRLARGLEGTQTHLLDTRKTVPVMRALAKYAVRCGGGENHRRGLYDMILIKENHMAAARDFKAAVAGARKAYPELRVEVEVTSLEELDRALDAKPDRILLDNFDPAKVKQAVTRVDQWAGGADARRPEIEVSG